MATTWPAEFTNFLKEHSISPDIYSTAPQKYFCCLDDISGILQEFPKAERLDWATNFFVLPSDTSVAHTTAFRTGKILPMDPSSWLAVENLSLQPGEHVLDLCCAPGTKLALISKAVCPVENDIEGSTVSVDIPKKRPVTGVDILKRKPVTGADILKREPVTGADISKKRSVTGISVSKKGSVTGVDISKKRLASACTLAKKYKLPRVRLFCSDGRTFSTRIHDIMTDGSLLKFQDLYPISRPAYSSTPYRKYPGRFSDCRYDKVLVDAQCTHDGSIKHVRKYIETAWRNFDPSHYSSTGLAELYQLQLALLENGFRQLRSGGILVYSTCSLTREQNEDIIEKFMSTRKLEATIMDPIGPIEYMSVFNEFKAMRIAPSKMMGGGFFLCRIKKCSK